MLIKELELRETDNIAEIIGQLLREARAKAGMTRKQLAKTSGASERYLAHLEAGTGNPTISVLISLASSLNIAVADLLPLGGEKSELRANAASLLRRMPEKRVLDVLKVITGPVRDGASKAKLITLVGLRGAGKTSLGKALAERLGIPFLEMSKEVERIYGGEIGLLIELGGQGALSRHERKVWDDITSNYDEAVIATRGGLVADPPLFDKVIASSYSVWLQATPEDHMERVMQQGDFRPMTGARNAMRDLKTILEARTPDYSKASVSLNTSKQDFDQTLNRLIDILSQD